MGAINTLKLLHQLRKNQWLSPSELEELQAKKLRAMIKHAYENTEFYHSKFKTAGIRPDDIKTVEDLKKIPFTTKSELREHSVGSMLAEHVDLKRCLVFETTGSTGIPIKVAYDEAANDFSKAVNLLSHMENGLHVNSRWIMFGDPDHFEKKKWFQNLNIFNPMVVSVFDSVSKQISILRKFKPEVLDGYTSSIRLLAKAVEENKIKDIKPKVVFGTSEQLDNNTREYINSVFNVKMIDHFGCAELNRTAWECSEHAGYHIDSDAVVMEFIRNMETVSAGERGEIVYTGLYNYAMPLIRYKIDDVGIPTDELCPCGRGLPLMKIVEGRTDSFMQVPDGRIFSPIIWPNIMKCFQDVDQFKAIQEKKDFIRILLVKKNDLSKYTIDKIKLKIKEVMGQEINVEIEIVDEIKKEKGKVRSAVSKIRVEF